MHNLDFAKAPHAKADRTALDRLIGVQLFFQTALFYMCIIIELRIRRIIAYSFLACICSISDTLRENGSGVRLSLPEISSSSLLVNCPVLCILLELRCILRIPL